MLLHWVGSFLSSAYILGFAASLVTAAGLVYFYLTRHFGKWERKYGVKGLEPVPLFGTEKALLLGKVSINDHVVGRYNAFEGHK